MECSLHIIIAKTVLEMATYLALSSIVSFSHNSFFCSTKWHQSPQDPSCGFKQ